MLFARKTSLPTTPKPDPAPKTKNPDLDPATCPSLPCFYIHSIYIIPYILNPDPASVFHKNLNPDAKT